MFGFRAARLALAAGTGLVIFVTPVAATAQVTPDSQQKAAGSQPLTRAALANQLDANFKAMDSDGDKSIGAAELEASQKAQAEKMNAAIMRRLDAQFTKLDSNKDGQLSPAEFRAAAPTPKVRPAGAMLAEFDRNKDGKVTIEEHRAAPLANFDRLDTDKDGTLSDAEQRAARARR